MKKLSFLLLLLLSLSFVSCAQVQGNSSEEGVPVRDTFGNTAVLTEQARVVSCYGSYADCWLLSGGSLVGVTDDAVEEGLNLSSSVEIVGSVKSVDLEKILTLSPDYVILSADLAAHLTLQEALDTMGIAYGFFRVDTFADYKGMMAQFCTVNGRPDLYETNVLAVEKRIEEIRAKIPQTSSERFLLLRVYSTGMKAKGADILAGQILLEFGLTNIAQGQSSLLENLSAEEILLQNPAYIFTVPMGDPSAAEAFWAQTVMHNPAWQSLTAIKEGACFMLPKDLFHYKPNERWDECYEYLAKILYPELFAEP